MSMKKINVERRHDPGCDRWIIRLKSNHAVKAGGTTKADATKKFLAVCELHGLPGNRRAYRIYTID